MKSSLALYKSTLQPLRPTLAISPFLLSLSSPFSNRALLSSRARTITTISPGSKPLLLCTFGRQRRTKIGIESRKKSTKPAHLNELPSTLKRKFELLELVEEDLSLTRPPFFDLPDRPSSNKDDDKVSLSERIKFLYRLGRAYLNFYKRSIKQVWTCFKVSRKYVSWKDFEMRSPEFISMGVPVRDERLRCRYWNNLQFIQRSRHDARKMLPFGLILLICGEFTPLVLLAIGSSFIPDSCKIPSQVLQERKHALTRISGLDQFKIDLLPELSDRFKNYTDDEILKTADLLQLSPKPGVIARILPRSWLLRICRMRLKSWNARNMTEFNLLSANSLQHFPPDELVRLCLLMGHYSTSRRRTLESLIRNISVNERFEVIGFDLQISEENLAKARRLLGEDLLQLNNQSIG
ncbi:MAG: hypothetical protein Q9160_001175 [Pyrenula sp. 1 TL-2023]